MISHVVEGAARLRVHCFTSPRALANVGASGNPEPSERNGTPLRTRTDIHTGLEGRLGSRSAALLVRFRSFRRLLFTENRDSDQKVKLILFLVPPLAIGVMLRIFGGYRFFDLTLEGSFLLGLLGGQVVGLLGGSLVSLPAFGNHEWLATPMAALVGLLAGVVREVIPEKEDVWHFGPFLFLNIPQWLWRLARHADGELGHATAIHLRGV